MARTLLDILNGPFPKAEARTPNEKGMTPLPQETGARAFLKTLKVQAQRDPFGNDDSFSAKDVSVFDRAKNHFGYDYKTQGDYNNQGSPNYHVLRNPTLNVSTEETVFEAVDSVGLGSRTAWRVVNKLTKEYVTRSINKEDAEKIASDLNAELIQYILDEGKEGPTDEGSKAYKDRDKLRSKKYTFKDNLANQRKSARDAADRARIDSWISKEETESLDESVSRKYFREVANTVRSIEDPGKRQEFADHHASILKGQNPRFSHDKFHAACGTKTKRERGLHTSMGEDVEQIDETPMPKSVLQHKTKIQNMGHDERKKYFAGKSVATLKSMAWRHGHGKDSDAYSKYHDGITKEDVEQIDELSKKAHRRYQWVAGKEIMNREKKLPQDIEQASEKDHDNAITIFKRQRGIDRSNRLLNRKRKNNEETEAIAKDLNQNLHEGRDRTGQRVKIRHDQGGMKEFHGKTGIITGKEGTHYRVRLDNPVHVPGVGHVKDDLWEPHHLKKIREETRSPKRLSEIMEGWAKKVNNR